MYNCSYISLFNRMYSRVHRIAIRFHISERDVNSQEKRVVIPKLFLVWPFLTFF